MNSTQMQHRVLQPQYPSKMRAPEESFFQSAAILPRGMKPLPPPPPQSTSPRLTGFPSHSIDINPGPPPLLSPSSESIAPLPKKSNQILLQAQMIDSSSVPREGRSATVTVPVKETETERETNDLGIRFLARYRPLSFFFAEKPLHEQETEEWYQQETPAIVVGFSDQTIAKEQVLLFDPNLLWDKVIECSVRWFLLFLFLFVYFTSRRKTRELDQQTNKQQNGLHFWWQSQDEQRKSSHRDTMISFPPSFPLLSPLLFPFFSPFFSNPFFSPPSTNRMLGFWRTLGPQEASLGLVWSLSFGLWQLSQPLLPSLVSLLDGESHNQKEMISSCSTSSQFNRVFFVFLFVWCLAFDQSAIWWTWKYLSYLDQ